MKLFLACTANECLKLARRKKYFVFLAIEIFICVCVVLIQAAVNRAMDGTASLQFANLSLSMLTFFIRFYIPLVVFMASCDLYATEMQDNSIKAVLMRPVSRLKIFLSKALAITIYAVVYLVSLFLVTNILEAATSGRVFQFWTGFGAYFLDVFPLVALVMMAALINQIGKSSSLSMFMCILIYAMLCVAGIVIPFASGLLFTGYSQWHNIWLGATLPFSAMISKIGLLLGYCAVFGCGGYYLFDKKDF